MFIRTLLLTGFLRYSPRFETPAERSGNPTLTIEQQLDKSRADLTAAESRATTAEGLLQAEKDKTTAAESRATAAEGALQGEKDKTTAAESRATAAEGKVIAITGERDTARSRISLLEGYCRVKGIDPDQAVPADNKPGPSDTESKITDLVRQRDACKDPAQAMKLSREIRKLRNAAE